MDKLVFPTKEAQAILSCGTTKFYEYCAIGRLDARKIGSRTVVTAESLERLVASLPRAKIAMPVIVARVRAREAAANVNAANRAKLAARATEVRRAKAAARRAERLAASDAPEALMQP